MLKLPEKLKKLLYEIEDIVRTNNSIILPKEKADILCEDIKTIIKVAYDLRYTIILRKTDLSYNVIEITAEEKEYLKGIINKELIRSPLMTPQEYQDNYVTKINRYLIINKYYSSDDVSIAGKSLEYNVYLSQINILKKQIEVLQKEKNNMLRRRKWLEELIKHNADQIGLDRSKNCIEVIQVQHNEFLQKINDIKKDYEKQIETLYKKLEKL